MNQIVEIWQHFGHRTVKVVCSCFSAISKSCCAMRKEGQVAKAARHLDTDWTTRVRSRMSEGWRFFFAPSCPDWSWCLLSLL